MLETIERLIIDALAIYVLYKNLLYIKHSRGCDIHNWELGIPGIIVSLLTIVFHIFLYCDFLPREWLMAYRRMVTIITLFIFAGQAGMRNKCFKK